MATSPQTVNAPEPQKSDTPSIPVGRPVEKEPRVIIRLSSHIPV